MKLIHVIFDWTAGRPVEGLLVVDVPDAEFQELKNELEDSFASYMESAFDESVPTPYTKAVKDVMDASGYSWMTLSENDFHTIRI